MIDPKTLTIEGSPRGELQKRTVFPGVIVSAKCPWCDGYMTADLGKMPLNYPEINKNNYVYLTCEDCFMAEHPDAVIKVPVFLSVEIQVAKEDVATF
jgi:hypothetical protein